MVEEVKRCFCEPKKLFKFEEEGDTEKCKCDGMEFYIFKYKFAKPPFYTAHVITKDTPIHLFNIQPITPKSEFRTREEAIQAIEDFAKRFGYRKDITSKDIKIEARLRAIEKIIKSPD